MAYKKGSGSTTKQGIRSPMCGFEQQQSRRTPSIGTTEMIRGSAPKPAKIQSPNKSKATGN